MLNSFRDKENPSSVVDEDNPSSRRKRIAFYIGGAFLISVSLPIFIGFVQTDFLPNGGQDFGYLFLGLPSALIAAVILSLGIVFLLYGFFFGRIREEVVTRLRFYKPVLLIAFGLLLAVLDILSYMIESTTLTTFFSFGFFVGGLFFIAGILVWLKRYLGIFFVKKLR